MILDELLGLLSEIGVDADSIYVRKERNQVLVPCPLAPWFHKKGTDNTPSCSIGYGKKSEIKPSEWTVFKCFSCKEHGQFWELVDSLGRLSHNSQIIELAEHVREYDRPTLKSRIASIQVEYKREKSLEAIELSSDILNRFYKAEEFPRSLSYLVERFKKSKFKDLKGESAIACTFHTSKFWGLLYDEKYGRIVYPVYNRVNNLLGAVGRTILDDPESLRNRKYYNYFSFAASKTLGGLATLLDHPRVIVVEGFFDIINCYEWADQLGYDIVCSWKAELSKTQVDILLSLDKTVIIAFDNDDAGNDGWEKAKKFLGPKTFGMRRADLNENDLGAMTEDEFNQVFS